MKFTDTLLFLIAKKGISKNKMLTDLKLAKGSFSNWKNRGTIPNGDTLAKIAKYFDVTTDYLLGSEQKNKPDTNSDGLGPKGKDILERLNKIEALSKEDFDFAVAQLDLIINRREKQDKK